MAKSQAGQPPTHEALHRAITRATAKAAPRAAVEAARRALLAWLDTAARHGLSPADMLRRLASGEAATGVGRAVGDALAARPPAGLETPACRSGCAFCCILNGGDGGTITETEARQVHGALAPLAGGPDGRSWHPAACPALDPEAKTCRIYDARPVLCRAFVSTDAGACEANAAGGAVAGAGLLGSHVTYLAALALARSALDGTARVRTFALDRLAAASLEGKPLAEALEAARQKPRALDDALRGSGRALAAAQRG